MNKEENILDAPMATQQKVYTGPDYSVSNSLDFIFNAFLLGVAGLIAISILVESGAFVYLMLWNLVLGAYQLLSALVGALRGNRKKLYYLVAALGYLVLLYTIGTEFDAGLTGDNEMYFWGLTVVALPLAGAVYYTFLCWQAKNRI